MSNEKTVSDLVAEIKSLLEGEFKSVSVSGEISNWSLSSSGHYYFTLKDKEASISCALFKGDALRNPLVRKIKEGDSVSIIGSVGVYAPRGTFQIIVKRILPLGEGELKLKLEELKRKLSDEGLFDLTHKRKIPKFPKKIALITSLSGAALQDFLKIYSRRAFGGTLFIIPSLVQGESAPASLVNALKRVEKYNETFEEKIEVTLLLRGGGALEDLWAFNDESLAREIFSHPIPVISAVGHEVDYSISDYTADFRAETPSAAAEVLTEASSSLFMRMKGVSQRLSSSLISLFMRFKMRVQRCALQHRATDLLKIYDYFQRLDSKIMTMEKTIEMNLFNKEKRLSQASALLEVLGPAHVLQRGYTYLTDNSGDVISTEKKFKTMKPNDHLKITFVDGAGYVTRTLQ